MKEKTKILNEKSFSSLQILSHHFFKMKKIIAGSRKQNNKERERDTTIQTIERESQLIIKK